MNVEAVLRRLGVEGRRFGEHLVATCPFHEDTKPSWRICLSGDRAGLHHCFSCGEGGNLVHLVQQVRGYATRAAARSWLDEHGGQVDARDLEVPMAGIRIVSESKRRAFRMAPGVTEGEPFDEWPTAMRRYVESRGITSGQVARWGIGYALAGRLKGRIVIPIRDGAGKLRSYVARLAFEEQGATRFLYPREEEGGDNEATFGEERWGDARVLVVTEGAIKSLAVERAFPEAAHAALGGSELRAMAAIRFARFPRVIALTDSDAAGEKARAQLTGALARHVELRHARLPEGKDADKVSVQELRAMVAPCFA